MFAENCMKMKEIRPNILINADKSASSSQMLLPPANEVWGRVIFSGRVSVILSGGGGGGFLHDVTSCLAVWSHVPSGGVCAWSHVPSRRGSLSRGVSV